MTRVQLPMGKVIITGRAKNPRHVKGINKPPCRYRGQEKSRMDSELYEDWIRDR